MPRAVAIIVFALVVYICGMRYLDQTQIRVLGTCETDASGDSYAMVLDTQTGRIGCLAIPSTKAL